MSNALSVSRVDGRGALVLPEATASAAVSQFFAWYGVEGVAAVPDGTDWVIRSPDSPRSRAVLQRVLRKADWTRIVRNDGALQLRWPAFTFRVKGQSARRLKQALAFVQPKQANGLPMPWVTPQAETAPLGRPVNDDDVVRDAQPASPPGAAWTGPTTLTTAAIRADFERLRTALDLPAFPLTIRRGAVHKRGVVTGRIHLRGTTPVEMVLTTCPNSDRAEAAATLVHEFAHVRAPGAGHDVEFKRAALAVAAQTWGTEAFAAGREALNTPYAVVDAWIAAGIRAQLMGAEAPRAVRPDEARIVVAVRRIQKLRALAADQLGRPEGALADAKANDLVVAHGLGDHRVALPGDLSEVMCDRWLLIGSRAPWRASVAFTIARVCDVFALQSTQYGGMHLFGRYADVVTAEHLYAVATDGIARRCARHLEAWAAGDRRRGRMVSERAAFLNSAAQGLRVALTGEVDAASERRVAAEVFASAEHDKRGMGWGGGGQRRFRYSAEGFAAGQSLQLARGVDGRAPGRLLDG